MTLNKKPISWYEENLINLTLFLNSKIKDKEQLEKEINDLKNRCEILSKRISKAKQLNLAEFDENQALMKIEKL